MDFGLFEGKNGIIINGKIYIAKRDYFHKTCTICSLDKNNICDHLNCPINTFTNIPENVRSDYYFQEAKITLLY